MVIRIVSTFLKVFLRFTSLDFQKISTHETFTQTAKLICKFKFVQYNSHFNSPLSTNSSQKTFLPCPDYLCEQYQSSKINTTLAFFIRLNELPSSYWCCFHNLPHSFPFLYFHYQQQFGPSVPSLRWSSHLWCACSNPSDLEMCSNSLLLAELLTELYPAAVGPHLICLTLFSIAPTLPPQSSAWVTVGCLQIFHNLPHLSCSFTLIFLKYAHLH